MTARAGRSTLNELVTEVATSLTTIGPSTLVVLPDRMREQSRDTSVTVPMRGRDMTTGVRGLLKYGDRRWTLGRPTAVRRG